ncbi:YbhB/YbcL family Raf kinase inhibitor-like protein [Actinomadura graeca]|uniref:YbhB/YbcL family Raf kinase inhibitor-like protein n=1 Tax=Actinomadura graeca TaxID=2750812 RepID=A0ABX8QLT0_9ACTN|nr:YbhB/YbcL family Raf kinase inhibitor-like protein [Actinomadura graeca]QXJ19573.1 YbhB/YbcL family Raf kinase inhibitor-like protein [Actinomadura graeca]
MITKRVMSYALIAASATGLSCAAAPPAAASPRPPAAPAAFTVTSTAFTEGGTIPKVHECTSGGNDPRQKNESPPLAWTGSPAAAQSYALIMRDLDNNNLLHWIIYDIPATATSLPQNVEHVYQPPVPKGSRQIYYRGSASLFGYQGPCSPNSVNTYEFVVHALNKATLDNLDADSSIQTAARTITQASIGSARITGES